MFLINSFLELKNLLSIWKIHNDKKQKRVITLDSLSHPFFLFFFQFFYPFLFLIFSV